MRVLLLGLGALGLCAGCCLNPTNPATSSGTSGGSSTAGTSGGGSTGGNSSTGGTGGASGPFVGEVQVATITTPGPSGSTRTYLQGGFTSARDWPACAIDAGVCCFYPESIPPTGLNAGLLTASSMLPDGGTQSGSVSFDPVVGAYHGQIFMPPDFPWFVSMSGSGDVVPAFTAGTGLQGYPPVLVPALTSLSSLSTSQDWTVPLVPSQLEYFFIDRVTLHVDAVGDIVCDVGDEGVLRPSLVVPASLLGRFLGHQGTVGVFRNDVHESIDAGALLLTSRVGIGTFTTFGGVYFGP